MPSVEGPGPSGEPQLERLAKRAGVLEHCLLTQRDMVVRLPGHRTIVVDAKTPALRLVDAIAGADENRRRSARGDLVATIQRRADVLRRASYWRQFTHAPAFVVLFLPNEALFHIVWQEHPALFEACFSQNVLIATPTTLVLVLRTVADAWRREASARNVHDMSKLSRELHDRIRIVADTSMLRGSAFVS